MRAALLLPLLLAAGCSIFEPDVIHAGERVCTGNCDELQKVLDELHTPAMEAAIAAAREGAPK